jgi:hypothetical protein
MRELPPYGMRAYALLYGKHGTSESFTQKELEWLVSEPMRKKTFALLTRAGWLKKASKTEYRCVPPEKAISGLLEPKVLEILKKTDLPYELTGASAIEIWSDYSYVQRSYERSPYFIKVLKKDLKKWRAYLDGRGVQNYVGKGSTIGEFAIFYPVGRLAFAKKDGLKVQPLEETLQEAEGNALFRYAADYMKKKRGG